MALQLGQPNMDDLARAVHWIGGPRGKRASSDAHPRKGWVLITRRDREGGPWEHADLASACILRALTFGDSGGGGMIATVLDLPVPSRVLPRGEAIHLVKSGRLHAGTKVAPLAASAVGQAAASASRISRLPRCSVNFLPMFSTFFHHIRANIPRNVCVPGFP